MICLRLRGGHYTGYGPRKKEIDAVTGKECREKNLAIISPKMPGTPTMRIALFVKPRLAKWLIMP